MARRACGPQVQSRTGSQRWRRVAGSRSREGAVSQRFAQASRLGGGGVVLTGRHASRVRMRHATRRWRCGRHGTGRRGAGRRGAGRRGVGSRGVGRRGARRGGP
eukprot:scaffold61441_cov67-Phaeocystis_antarctica.AAC.1